MGRAGRRQCVRLFGIEPFADRVCDFIESTLATRPASARPASVRPPGESRSSLAARTPGAAAAVGVAE